MYFLFLNNAARAASIEHAQVFQILWLLLVLPLLGTWVRLLFKIGPEHQLDTFESQTRANLYGCCGPATIMNDHAHEPVTKLNLVLQPRDLFLEVQLHVIVRSLHDVVRGEGLPVDELEFEVAVLVLLRVLLSKFNDLLHLTLPFQKRLVIAWVVAGHVRHSVGWKARGTLWLSHLKFGWRLQVLLGLVRWEIHFRFFVRLLFFW